MMKDFLVTTYVGVKMDTRVKTAKVGSTERHCCGFCLFHATFEDIKIQYWDEFSLCTRGVVYYSCIDRARLESKVVSVNAGCSSNERIFS